MGAPLVLWSEPPGIPERLKGQVLHLALTQIFPVWVEAKDKT